MSRRPTCGERRWFHSLPLANSGFLPGYPLMNPNYGCLEGGKKIEVVSNLQKTEKIRVNITEEATVLGAGLPPGFGESHGLELR